MKTLKFKIQDMGCQNCAAAIRSEIEKLPGILDIQLDPESKAAAVAFKEALCSKDKIFQAVREAGFTPEE
ncbi:heavy-metal-associated domain-containing protein [bacterium]|nr:heavy-metal-associated domain-containing protein [bacterium]